MNALIYTLGVVAVRPRRHRLDRAARGRAHVAGQEVRRQGHPVLRRLRPTRSGRSSAARPSTASRPSRSAATSSWSGCCRRRAATTRTRCAPANTGLFTQLVADARHAEYEHVTDDDLDRLFYRKPWWQKLIVMSGGPMVNVAIAVVLFSSSSWASASRRPPRPSTPSPTARSATPRPAAPAPTPTRSPRLARRVSSRATRSSPSTAPPITSWGQLTEAHPQQRRPRGHARRRA